MRIRLDKWYLDFQSGSRFAYWYVGRLQIGGLRLVTAESHEYGDTGVERHSWWEHERPGGPRKLRTRGAVLTAGRRETTLELATAGGPLSATWRSPCAPPARPFRPLFQNNDGWCDWKIWAPRADVRLRRGEQEQSGVGYVDLVRFELPFWRVPFRSLCWGRLTSADRWIVLFRLDTGTGSLACALDDSGWRQDVSVEVVRGPDATLPVFRWRVGERLVDVETRRVLERGPILSTKRLGLPMPRRFADALGSGGHEEKYWSTCQLDGAEAAGPMEEVRWDGR